MKRVLVTLHLPLEMGAAARIMKACAIEWPDAAVADGPSNEMRIIADDDVTLTRAQRRAMVKQRQAEYRARAAEGPGFGVAVDGGRS